MTKIPTDHKLLDAIDLIMGDYGFAITEERLADGDSPELLAALKLMNAWREQQQEAINDNTLFVDAKQQRTDCG